ncbi:uncharacterized protein LOC121866784 isoform X2 [Homarus americanus]|nr:uncharacterized protein LOC121866784 isoform X2 [Homarus americanus]
MLLMMVTVVVAVGSTDAGEFSLLRPPVRFYAGVHSPQEPQSVLVEPTLPPPQQIPTSTSPGRKNSNKDAPVISTNNVAEDPMPTPAALRQRPFIGTPGKYLHPFNRTGALMHRFRQQMQGRRAGSRRQGMGGFGLGNRRVRPGMARLGAGGSSVASHRRRPVGSESLTSFSQWMNAPGVLRNRVPLKNNADLLSSSTSQPNDFLSGWHNSYSRSQTKAQNATSDERVTTELSGKIEDPSNSPQRPAASQSEPGYRSSGAAKTTNRKSSFGLFPKHPYATAQTPQANVPSVHDMTSLHFKKTHNSSSSGAPNMQTEILKEKRTRFSERPITRQTGATSFTRDTTRTTTTTTTTTTKTPTTPLPIRYSATKAPPHGKDILASIQSIFEAAKTDERELSSMKNINHGNTSPQPLDIFSGISPSYGFVPSNNDVQSVLSRLNTDTLVSQIQTPHSIPQVPANPSVLITSQRPNTPDLESQASEAITNILMPQRPTSGDSLMLHVGHSIPVQAQQTWRPEHRAGSEGDIILDEGPMNDVIVGSPATLIQAPPNKAPVVVTSTPASQNQFGNPVHFRNTEEPTTQHSIVMSPSSELHPDELGPLLDFINSKYKPHQINTVPSSVTSLQSMINAGRIPEVFKREHVMDVIRDDRLRYRPQPVNRNGEPWRNMAVERTRTHPEVKNELSNGGQFVALSSIALLVAFCGYFLYAGSGATKEARKVLHPLKVAVDEARNGLHLLLRGLDEYEDHLIKEEEIENEHLEPPHIEKNNTTQSDIPTILKKMWNSVVPAEVRITSGTVKHATGGYQPVDASSLIRGNKSRRINNSGSRQPHAIEAFPSHKTKENHYDPLHKNNTSYNETVARPAIGLASVANSFLNSLINTKAVENIISQLKSFPVTIEKDNNPLIKPQEDIQELNPQKRDDEPIPELKDDLKSANHDLVSQDNSQEFEKVDSTTNNPEELDYLTTEESLGQESLLITFAGTGLRQKGLREVTTEQVPTSASKRFIVNNRMHIRHDPETDPPRTSVFVNNVPLKPAS